MVGPPGAPCQEQGSPGEVRVSIGPNLELEEGPGPPASLSGAASAARTGPREGQDYGARQALSLLMARAGVGAWEFTVLCALRFLNV